MNNDITMNNRLNHNDYAIRTDRNEGGAILILVMILVFAVSLALTAYLYVDKTNILIASNIAVQNAAQEATDVGLDSVDQYLQTTNPSFSGVGYFYPSINDVPASYGAASTTAGRPVPPVDAFWSGCAQNNTCYSLPKHVQYGPYDFNVEYVIFASPGLPQPESGYQVSGTSAPVWNDYLVYVHAQNVHNSGMSVTTQAFIDNPS